MIWEYHEVSSADDGLAELIRASAPFFIGGKPGIRICPFCSSTDMRTLADHSSQSFKPPRRAIRLVEDVGGGREYFSVHVCAVCGWWNVFRREEDWRQQPLDVFETYTTYNAAWGVLKTFDIADLKAPTEELIKYLAARYDRRFEIHPRKFEEIVGAIYAAEGFSVRVTSYRGDRGHDVIILDGPGDKEVGIEVRRHKGKIEAEPIRSLAGAMMLNGVTQGAFVTTSSFTKGARTMAREYRKLGRPIELIDAPSFFDRLRLRQRALYRDPPDSWCPFSQFLLRPEGPLGLPAIYEEPRRYHYYPSRYG